MQVTHTTLIAPNASPYGAPQPVVLLEARHDVPNGIVHLRWGIFDSTSGQAVLKLSWTNAVAAVSWYGAQANADAAANVAMAALIASEALTGAVLAQSIGLPVITPQQLQAAGRGA